MNLKEIIKESLAEDIGHGDVSTAYLDLDNKISHAVFVAKENGVLAGKDLVVQIFEYLDPNTKLVFYFKDGDKLEPGDEIARIEGKTVILLKGERVALNFLQRLSGIATATSKLVSKITNKKTKLLDTRKTTPLLRSLEKYAVSVGGGYNHRFGLYDMIMLKENHIRAAGSISAAVEQIKRKNTSYKIEVEVTNLTELDEAYNAKVDRVMLDNMSIDEMNLAVKKYSGKIELEASGNVSFDNIETISSTGVDYISTGAITHSYKSLDISLLFKE